MSKIQIFINLCTIFFIIFAIDSCLRDEFLAQIEVKINEYYFFEGDIDHNNVDLCKSKNTPNCFEVKKVSDQYKDYLIGQAENGKYFYINYSNEEKTKFNLSKEEIEKIFSKKIKFKKIQKYMNRYDGGKAIEPDMILLASFIKMLISIPVIFILIWFKLYPKSWR